MFMYVITPIHSNPVEDVRLTPIFASTYTQVGRLIRKHAEANTALFDDVTTGYLHPDMGLTFEVTKGADPRLLLVTPVMNPNRTVSLFTEGRR